MPCCLTPKMDGQRAILDPAEWSEAMLQGRRPFVTESGKGGRSTDYKVDRVVSQMRAIPVVPPGWKAGEEGRRRTRRMSTGFTSSSAFSPRTPRKCPFK